MKTFPCLLTVCWSGPFFVIRHPRVKHHQSEVYAKAKKGDKRLDMPLENPVVLCGDVMIEFYNKTKMMKKV